MKNPESTPPALQTEPPDVSSWQQWTGRLAVASALIFAMFLAWRPIRGNDMGYHLAYGDTFLDTGRIVDGDDFLYVQANPSQLDMKKGNRPPGAWIDSIGRYRFPNANYGSQIVMSLVYRAGGFTGLCLLQAALVAILMVLCALTMHRLGVGRGPMAAGIMLVAMVGYARFDLRPEVFGYVFLAAVALVVSSRQLTRLAVVALILAHWAAVQVHSYWLLGLFLVGMFWAEAMVTCLCSRRTPDASEADRRRLQRLTIALGAMALVTFLNPWTWRLAALPIQTVRFLRDNNIPTYVDAPKRHPWAAIGEFFPPFQGVVRRTRSVYAYVVVLGLTGLGAAAALWKRRWVRLGIMAFMVAVSLKMRRNTAPAAVVLVPAALASLAELLRAARPKSILDRTARWAHKLRVPGAAVVIAMATYWSVTVATNRFYYVERRPWRFGAGHSSWYIPIDASRLLPHLPRNVRVFTSYNLSSTVLYFSKDAKGFRRMPILTNTWAYPAKTTMALNMNLCTGRPYDRGRPDFSRFQKFAADYGVGIAVLDCNSPNARLAKFLLMNKWKWAHFDGRNVVLLRPDLPVPEELQERRSLEQIIDDIRREETLPAHLLNVTAISFHRLGLDQKAEQCWRACVQADPSYMEAWTMLGRVLYEQAIRMSTGTSRRLTLIEAGECIDKALALRPDYARARSFLDDVESEFKRFQR